MENPFFLRQIELSIRINDGFFESHHPIPSTHSHPHPAPGQGSLDWIQKPILRLVFAYEWAIGASVSARPESRVKN